LSGIRSGLDELSAEDLSWVDDEALEGDVEGLERAAAALRVEILRRVREVDRRRSFRRNGQLSTAAWLVWQLRVSRGEAARSLRIARALEEMPIAREAVVDGAISLSALSVLVAAREGHAEEFAAAEETLVESARTLPVGDLHRVVSYWKQAIDVARAEEDERSLHMQRRLHVSPTLSGMVRVDGDLDPETGQALLTALRAVVDAEVRSGMYGNRTGSQAYADALGEICRQWLDRTDRSEVAGERPHVSVTVDLTALQGTPGAASELADAGPLVPETARRLACDASISRIIVRGRSEPLDVGRRTPVVSAALRRAVVLRDGHCRFPGCDRPQSWCDAHHIQHWADGGRTALDNLVLLCRRHHRLIHGPPGFRVAIDGKRPVFRRPNGTVLDDRAPP
jgi:hypothetical protein